MKPKALLFDFDGTLVNTPELEKKSWLEAYADVTDIPMQDEGLMRLVSQGLSSEEILRALGKNPLLASTITEMRRKYFSLLLFTELAWYPDALKAIDALHGRLPMGIVTNASRGHIECADELLKVHRRFQVVIAHEQMEGLMKPHPYGLHLGAQALDIEADRIGYVGDQKCDMLAAATAGMRRLHIRRDHTHPDVSAMADETFTQLDELVPWLLGD